MNPNPWKPIADMRLGIIGATIDLEDHRRLYSGVTVAGIRYEHEHNTITNLLRDPIAEIGKVSEFTIITTTAEIRITPEAEWRHHA